MNLDITKENIVEILGNFGFDEETLTGFFKKFEHFKKDHAELGKHLEALNSILAMMENDVSLLDKEKEIDGHIEKMKIILEGSAIIFQKMNFIENVKLEQ